MRKNRVWSVAGAMVLAASCAVCGPLAGEAMAQSVEDANRPYALIKADLRSDKVLLPVLAKMQAPPASVSNLEKARMLPAGKAGWEEAAAWATAQPQKDVLAALKKVTGETDFKKAYAFGQPYGIDGVDVEMIQARMYTELGDPPTLAAAKHLYMPALDRMMILANVEASRLVAEGKANDAVEVLISALFFARQMCDRAFMAEVRWGFEGMIDTYERIRDVLYVDMKSGKQSITEKNVLDLLKKIDESVPALAYVDVGRVRWPEGDGIAARQALSMVAPGGTINARAFGSTASRARTSQHPLRIFSEDAKWQAAAAGHEDASETGKQLEKVWGDWNTRWKIDDYFDRRMLLEMDYQTFDRKRFAIIAATLPDMADLIDDRQKVRIEAAGTRTASAMVGLHTVRKMWPRDVSAIRPRYVRSLDIDPFTFWRGGGNRPPLRYLVPPEGGQQVTVALPGDTSFTVRVMPDTFIMYSIGSDYEDNKARRLQNTIQKVEINADYLIWPPMLSLRRQNLVDLGELK